VQLTGEAAPDTLVDQQTMTLTVTADATALPEHLELSIAGKRAGSSLSAGDVRCPAGTELSQDPSTSWSPSSASSPRSSSRPSWPRPRPSWARARPVRRRSPRRRPQEAGEDTGSESDKAGEGDEVGETDAPKSETPAE
jgi:large subunit ribosomal protein L25